MDLHASISDDTVTSSMEYRNELDELDGIIPKLSEMVEQLGREIDAMTAFKAKCERAILKMKFFKKNNIVPAEETIEECKIIINTISHYNFEEYFEGLLDLMESLLDEGE